MRKIKKGTVSTLQRALRGNFAELLPSEIFYSGLPKFLGGDMGKTIIIGEKQLAKQFLITERQVRSLFKNFKYAPGEYFYGKCVKEYIKQIKSKSGDHNVEDQKLKKAKRETQEFNLKILKDEYYPDHIVRGSLADMLIKFKSQLLSASRKITIELEQNENPDVKKIVEKHVLKSLEELEKYDPPSNKGGKR